MNIPYEVWKDFLDEYDLDQYLKNSLLIYINKLTYKELPVIFELNHLSLLIGIKYPILIKMVNSPESFYYSFKLEKKKGGFRKINSPYPALKLIQNWILENILEKITLSKYAKAYIKGSSILDNATIHLNQDEILKVDLENFFGSIHKRRIITVFQQLGYSNKVSYYLASLCCFNNSLPQGACTSPYLSNIITKRLDKKISKICTQYRIKYSRYADDLTFSGEFIPRPFFQEIVSTIKNEKFKINEAKTLHLRKENKKIITGISITNGRLRLPKEKRRKLRQEIFYIKKLGIITHKKNIKNSDPIYLERLIGNLNFWPQIEPINKFILDSLSFLKSRK